MNKVVVTGYWQGEKLEFDLWPPPRPSDTAQLNWTKQVGLEMGDGISMTVQPTLVENPNHLHVILTSASRDNMKFDWELEDGGSRSAGSPCFYPGPPFFNNFQFRPSDPAYCTLWGVLSQEPTDELQMLSFSGGN